MNINRLLSKKTWRGEEVGKALIASLANDIRMKNRTDWKPLFPQAEFNRMVDSLTTEVQVGKYLVYEKIYSSVMDYYNKTQALQQQFWHGYYRLLCTLEQIQQADNALKAVEEYPLILTESQYQKIKDAVWTKNENETTTFNNILFDYLEHCIDFPEEAPASVLKALEACKAETVSNERLIDAYREEGHGNFYYELPDGTNSRDTTEEEWQKALEKATAQAWTASKKGYYKLTIDDIIRSNNLQNRMDFLAASFKGGEALEAYYEEITGEEYDAEEAGFDLEEAAEYILNMPASNEADAFNNLALKKVKTSEPISKYDLITAPCMVLHYNGLAPDTDDISPAEQLREFKEDYPGLYKALYEETRNLLGIKGKISLKKKYRMGELAAMDILDYADTMEPTQGEIIRYYTDNCRKPGSRAAYNGIAIVTPDHVNVDRNTGDYMEPANIYSNMATLDNLSIEQAEVIDSYKEILMEPSVTESLAFNKMLDILAELYDIPDIKVAEAYVDQFIEKAKTYNTILLLFYSRVGGTVEEKKKRRQVIRDSFPLLDIEAYKVDEDTAEQIKGHLAELKLTRAAAMDIKANFEKYILQLKESVKKEGEDGQEEEE